MLAGGGAQPSYGHAQASSEHDAILRGDVVVLPHWLEFSLVADLRAEALALDTAGEFLRSGVATAGIDGVYGKSDRRVCVLDGGVASRADGSKARAVLETRLASLCAKLGRELGRPTLLCAEQYLSISTHGASLGLHMDERHEETKGAAAWEMPTRRSISWVLYLSADGWGETGGRPGAGGQLRAFCRNIQLPRRTGRLAAAACGAHEGNLQVGWLEGDEAATADAPIFLDGWMRERVAMDGRDTGMDGCNWRPRYALYRVGDDGQRDYLTPAFGPDSPSWVAALSRERAAAAAAATAATDGERDHDDGVPPEALYEALRAQLPSAALRDSFCSVEAVTSPRQTVRDVNPLGGQLVLFDAVAVPHLVLPTVAGERIALAGWLHEEQQPAPDWYCT